MTRPSTSSKTAFRFMRFVGLPLHDPVPDGKTIWLSREQLARAGVVERLFARFDLVLNAAGFAVGPVDSPAVTACRSQSALISAGSDGCAAIEAIDPASRLDLNSDTRKSVNTRAAGLAVRPRITPTAIALVAAPSSLQKAVSAAPQLKSYSKGFCTATLRLRYGSRPPESRTPR
jgi:hypothetical protein